MSKNATANVSTIAMVTQRFPQVPRPSSPLHQEVHFLLTVGTHEPKGVPRLVGESAVRLSGGERDDMHTDTPIQGLERPS